MFAKLHQVVDGAGNDGGVQQPAGGGVGDERAEDFVVYRAVADVGERFAVKQAFGGFAAGFFRRRVVFFFRRRIVGTAGKQFFGRAAADQCGKAFVFFEFQPLAQGEAGLQGEHAQAEGDGKARAAVRIGKGVHDAGVGKRFAAAGAGEVDAEEALFGRGRLKTAAEVEGFVLPLETGICGGLSERAVVAEGGQFARQQRQQAGEAGGEFGDAAEVFVEFLFGAFFFIFIGVGVEFGHAFQTACVVWRQGGVVVVAGHQAQAGEVQEQRIGGCVGMVLVLFAPLRQRAVLQGPVRPKSRLFLP